MRRFQFRLAPLQKLREHKERDWELKLAAKTSECVRLQEEIAARRAERDSSFGIPARQEGGRRILDLSGLHARSNYVARLDNRISELEQELEEREKEREEIRKSFEEAMKARKVLEALQERRSAEHYREERRQEDKRLNDIGAGKAAVQRLEQEERDGEL